MTPRKKMTRRIQRRIQRNVQLLLLVSLTLPVPRTLLEGKVAIAEGGQKLAIGNKDRLIWDALITRRNMTTDFSVEYYSA
jgi:hypothetical protein